MLAAERFRRLLQDLAPDAGERANGLRAYRAVRATLQSHYYGSLTMSDHSRLIGAWAKGTEVRPLRSIDVLFALPRTLHERNSAAQWDEGTALRTMSDVEDVLTASGRSTRLRADGFTVVVLADGQTVEVRPGFAVAGGRFRVCHAHGEGGFYTSDPALEEASLRQCDTRSHGNARDLIRMMKCWQAYRDVPLGSFAIELLAVEFLGSWVRAGGATSFYDWMIRDFLAFLVSQAGRTLVVPGAERTLDVGTSWLTPARTAHTHAIKACECESEGLNADAWWEWEKIFGERVPLEP